MMGSFAFPVSLFLFIGGLALLVGGTCLLKARRVNTPSASLHSDKSLVWCGITAPLLATGLYLILGSPDYRDQPFLTRSESVLQKPVSSSKNQEDLESADIREVIAKIKEKLPAAAGTPQETMGWMMLGRTYTKLKEYDNAADAYHNALDRVQNPDMKLKIQMEYLTILKILNPNGLSGEGQLVLGELQAQQETNSEVKEFLSQF